MHKGVWGLSPSMGTYACNLLLHNAYAILGYAQGDFPFMIEMATIEL